MAESTPVKYEDLTDELKKKHDEIKAVLEAELIGSFHRTRSHGVRWKGFSPEGALDGVDLSARQKNAPGRCVRRSTTWWLIHCTATLRACCNSGASGTAGGTSGADLEKQTWLAKYATPTNLQSPAPAVGSEPEKQAWLAKYATPANLQGSTPSAITADQICTILKDQFGMMPKRKTFGYTKPYPNEYELIPLPPKYRLPDFTKFSGSDGSSSIEHVSRYLAQWARPQHRTSCV
ncbi:hypothetical protein QYE76_030597 [Lolium multiflorum]|uniref:Uncharacterized protein n=1 Tax=Lolium multiflorum TaxID=4521 RepID=A0AAD8QRU7_LOLMU|nr:hypothetical protein QYE76_030597 [Lolium multiflorum]